MILGLLLSLIRSTEYVYLYTLKEGVVLFVHNSLKDDYEISMDLFNINKTERIFLLKKMEAERAYFIDKVEKVFGLGCFDHEKYSLFASDPISYSTDIKMDCLVFKSKDTNNVNFVNLSSHDLPENRLFIKKVKSLRRNSQFKALTDTSDLFKAILRRLSIEVNGNDKLIFSNLVKGISIINKTTRKQVRII